MTTLVDIVESLKSANAGATWVTFDIVMAAGIYESVRDANVISPEIVGQLYALDPSRVAVYPCDMIRTIKVTIPRRTGGGPEETDFDGTQQFAPLLGIDVPAAAVAR